MPYLISKTNGDLLINLRDKTADNTTTSLKLTGYGYPGWGLSVQENLVQLLENAASVTPPEKPLLGQLWFDTGLSKLNVQIDDWVPLATQEWVNANFTSLPELAPPQVGVTLSDLERTLDGYATVASVQTQIANVLTLTTVANGIYVTFADLTTALENFSPPDPGSTSSSSGGSPYNPPSGAYVTVGQLHNIIIGSPFPPNNPSLGQIWVDSSNGVLNLASMENYGDWTPLATQEWVTTQFAAIPLHNQDRVTQTELQGALAEMATEPWVRSQIEHLKIEDIINAGVYVRNDDLTVALGSYVTTQTLTTVLSGYPMSNVVVTEAPKDGGNYIRRNGAWVLDPTPGNLSVAEITALLLTLPTTLPSTPGNLWFNGGVLQVS